MTTAPDTATKFVIVARNTRFIHTQPRTDPKNLDSPKNKHEFTPSNISKILTLTISKNTRNQSRGQEKQFSRLFSPEKRENISSYCFLNHAVWTTAMSLWRQYELLRISRQYGGSRSRSGSRSQIYSSLIRSFSSNYESKYECKIRHFRAKLDAVSLRHLVVVGLLTTKLINKLALKSWTIRSFG